MRIPESAELLAVRDERTKHRKPPEHRRWHRRATIAALILLPVSVLALWIAIHRVGWLGPWLADTLRAIVGAEAVTELEKAAYSAQDWWDLRSRSDEAPQQYWEATKPQPASPSASASAASASPAIPARPPFRPLDVGPIYQDKTTDADGVWVPIDDPRHPQESPLAYKTMLHPDRRRSWSEVFIVALDPTRVRVHYMLGAVDPKPTTLPGRRVDRPALIPKAQWNQLVLAFNGGFKTEHRRYGAKVDGVFVVPGREGSCTISVHTTESGDQIQVRSWEALDPPGATATWLRQTPPCLCERGELHPGLRDEASRKWGSLFGETVIRRSALGLDRDGHTLFVGISNATTARVLARALRHAGAFDAAQLDVNWSYTKILLYRPGANGELRAESLVKGFVFDEDEYLRQRAPRDFFYVVRK